MSESDREDLNKEEPLGEKEKEPPGLDLAPLIQGWEYKPGEVTARLVHDSQGKEMIQLRVALGVLQMEIDGRPDGQRPNGYESYLEYQEDRLKKFFDENKTTDGFSLTPQESEELRQESHFYYLRYLCFFRLEDFERAARDTARNLHVLDLMMHHTQTEDDRLSLEQYRPYIMMMNARARASMAMKIENQKEACQVIQDTIEGIKAFYHEMEKEFEGLEAESLIEASEELVVLQELLKTINDEHEEHPPEPPQSISLEEPLVEEEPEPLSASVIEALKEELHEAVESEDYAKAASLRDRIRALEKVVYKHHGGIHG